MKQVHTLHELQIGDVCLLMVFDTHNHAVGDKYGWNPWVVEVTRTLYAKDVHTPYTTMKLYVDVIPLERETQYRVPTQPHPWYAHPLAVEPFTAPWQLGEVDSLPCEKPGYYFILDPNDRSAVRVHVYLLQHAVPFCIEPRSPYEVGTHTHLTFVVSGEGDDAVQLEDVEVFE